MINGFNDSPMMLASDGFLITLAGMIILGIILGFLMLRRGQPPVQSHPQPQQSQLPQEQKLFFNNIEHELRTALTLILLPTEHMLLTTQEPVNRHRLTTIEKNAHRIMQLVDQYLAVLKPDVNSSKPNPSVKIPFPFPVLQRHLSNDPHSSPLTHSLPNILLVGIPDLMAQVMARFFSKHYRFQHIIDPLAFPDQVVRLFPALVIIDDTQTNADGLFLCRSLKDDQRSSHIPVIMLLNSVSVENRIKALAQGADDCLGSHVHPGELFLRIRNLLDSQRRLRTWIQHETFRPLDN